MIPAFQGAAKRRIPERSSSSVSRRRVRGAAPRRARRCGAAMPLLLQARQWWRGGEPLLSTGDRRASSGVVRTGASRKESMSWLQGTLLSSVSCFQVSQLCPSSGKGVPFLRKNLGPAASRPSRSAEHRCRCLRGWPRGLTGEWDGAALRCLHPAMLRVPGRILVDLVLLIEFYLSLSQEPASVGRSPVVGSAS